MSYPVDGAGQIGTEEYKDIWFDCTKQLCDQTGEVVDSIASVEWSSDPNSITLSNDYILGVYVGVFVSDTEAATEYRVRAHVTTAAGRIFDAVYAIGGVKK